MKYRSRKQRSFRIRIVGGSRGLIYRLTAPLLDSDNVIGQIHIVTVSLPVLESSKSLASRISGTPHFPSGIADWPWSFRIVCEFPQLFHSVPSLPLSPSSTPNFILFILYGFFSTLKIAFFQVTLYQPYIYRYQPL